MKKYYYVRLYQALKEFGYIKKEQTISEIIDGFSDIPEVKSFYFDELETIIVEKISPFLVKEINTGTVFPIVNIIRKSSYVYQIYCVEKPMYESHTFILSKGDTIIGKEIKSISEIDKYNKKHPDSNQFKIHLQNIIKTGKNNMEHEKKEELKDKRTKIHKLTKDNKRY